MSKIPEVCAYCTGRIDHSEGSETRGSFRVHLACQADREREGVYLRKNGTMQVHANEINDPAIARSIILASMVRLLELKRKYA